MVAKLSGAARRDLADIRKYTVERWSRDYWLRYFAGLSTALEHIAGNPSCGRPRDLIHKGLRSLTCGQHLIFFHPIRHADGATVIVRIVHQRRNMAALSFSDGLED